MQLLERIIRRPVAVSMVMLVISVTGLFSVLHLPLELTPDVELPKLTIRTNWPNASPESVEAFITAPIEAVVATMPGISKLSSDSYEGRSVVTVEFTRNTRIKMAALQLGEQLALVKENLPHNASPPKIEKYIPDEFKQEAFLNYQVSGPYSLYEIRQIALEDLRTPLLALHGIADVRVFGGQDMEVHILLDRDKVNNLGVTPWQVIREIRSLNKRTQAGLLPASEGGRDVLVLNNVSDLRELRELPISAGGHIVRLDDIAEVRQERQHVSQLVRIDGNPAVSLIIYREPGSNTIEVADAVFQRLSELVRSLPPGVRLLKTQDESQKIRSDLRAISTRSVFCLLVILIVLLLFLQTLRMPMLVIATVAFAVLLTLNFFWFFDLTLNILTLAGLALGFGMLVDNAIVVIDNIHRLRAAGMERFQAAVAGTREVVLPLIASTITTVVVFLPFLYLAGELREFYLPFTEAVALSLLSSLLIALVFTPIVAAYIDPPVRKSASHGQQLYTRLQRRLLRLPLLMPVLAVALLAFTWHKFDEEVTIGEFWNWRGDTYIVCSARLPKGAQLQRSDDIARTFENKVVGLQGVKRVVTRVSSGSMTIMIYFDDEVALTAYPIMLRDQLSVLASRFAGISISVYGFGDGFHSGFGGSAPSFRVKVLGYSYDEVRRIAEDLGRRLQTSARVRNVKTAGSGRWWGGTELSETVLSIRRDRLAGFDVTVSDILGQVAAWLRENQSSQRIRLQGDDMTFRVKFTDFENFDIQNLYDVMILGRSGNHIRLADVAEIVERPVQSVISRENQQYQRWVTFEYLGPYKFGKRHRDRVMAATKLPPGYSLEVPSFQFGEDEQKELIFVGAIAVILVFMVMAALYESLLQPFIVLLSVPFGLIGVGLIYWLTETNFDRSAAIGVIMLTGIAVNNAILLVERISALKNQGMPVIEAIITGTGQRLRPVLMTTATTVLGLLPLVLAGGESTLWGTLALSTIGGLTSSTVLVLLVTPSLYRLFVRR